MSIRALVQGQAMVNPILPVCACPLGRTYALGGGGLPGAVRKFAKPQPNRFVSTVRLPMKPSSGAAGAPTSQIPSGLFCAVLNVLPLTVANFKVTPFLIGAILTPAPNWLRVFPVIDHSLNAVLSFK